MFPSVLKHNKDVFFFSSFHPFCFPPTNKDVFSNVKQSVLFLCAGEWVYIRTALREDCQNLQERGPTFCFLEAYLFLLNAAILWILPLAWPFVGESEALAPKSTSVSTHCSRHWQPVFATSFHKAMTVSFSWGFYCYVDLRTLCRQPPSPLFISMKTTCRSNVRGPVVLILAAMQIFSAVQNRADTTSISGKSSFCVRVFL